MNRHRGQLVAGIIGWAAISVILAIGGGSTGAVGQRQERVAAVNSSTVAQADREWVSAAELEGLAGIDALVDLALEEASLARILAVLARQGGFEIWNPPLSNFRQPASVVVSGVSVREVLEMLEELAPVDFRVVGPAHLAVRSRAYDPSRTPDLPDYAGYRRLRGRDRPLKVHHVNPEYPELARRGRLEGFVIVDLLVDHDGIVSDAHILQGLGLGIDVAARDAVGQWRFAPSVDDDGNAIGVVFTVTVVFNLNR